MAKRSARFNFRRVLTPIGFVRVPTARVVLSHGRKTVELEMTIDSGADLSMIPYQVGVGLGLATGKTVHNLSGVAGGLPYLLRRVLFRLGPFSFHARVAWAQRDDVPILLGRAGVFDRFAITFDEHRNSVTFRA